MPSVATSSSRPTNGEMYVAPALAASSACVALKHSVTLVLMPSSAQILVAFRPSAISGILTTMLGRSAASSRASFIISSQVVETTSAETGPLTTSQISSSTSRNLRPVLATSDGFVVTPSTRPMAAASLISRTSAVSMKNCTSGLQLLAPTGAGT
jgi:hypothetical protein